MYLLPSFDFSSVDETKLNKPQYNWGDMIRKITMFPKVRMQQILISLDVRIREFKQMVMAGTVLESGNNGCCI